MTIDTYPDSNMQFGKLKDRSGDGIIYGRSADPSESLRSVVEFLCRTMLFCKARAQESARRRNMDTASLFWGEYTGIRRTLYTLGFVEVPRGQWRTQIDERTGKRMNILENELPKITVEETTF
jgi:hypothetical protein